MLGEVAAVIEPGRAWPWSSSVESGGSVWLGAVDAAGRTVSAMQSLGWGFGSGVMLERTGVVWHNRGVSFSLLPAAVNALISGRRPFHTLNPMLAVFNDGRVMALGAMGGRGQPQSQATVFSRYASFGQDLQAAVTAPRWTLGVRHRPGAADLKLESRFAPELIEALRAVDRVVITKHKPNDLDMSVSRALRAVRPHIFANGGDRNAANAADGETKD